jgi:CHAD domain-containing protein
MPMLNWLLDGKTGHAVILRATDPDCLQGEPWGADRCRAAVEAFNAALGLERPQYVLTFEGGMIQAHVGTLADDAAEAELSRAHQLGVSGGYESAAGDVREAGVQHWKAGRDAQAKEMRDLADRLQQKANAQRPVPKAPNGS